MKIFKSFTWVTKYSEFLTKSNEQKKINELKCIGLLN